MSGFINSFVGSIVNQQAAYSPTPAYDVVAVFDNDFNQLFPDARPMKLVVKPVAKLMEHPAETGITITDHRVMLPTEFELSLVLLPETYVDTYNEILNAFYGSTTIQVQSNVGLHSNLLIKSPPHEENPDHFDTITMVVSLREVIFVQAATSAAVPNSTKNGGNKSGKKATSTEIDKTKATVKESVLHSTFWGKPKATSHPE